jgi:hypothetical protein
MSYFPFGETEGPSASDMGIEGDPTSEGGRPTPEDIEDRVANLEFQKNKFPGQYRKTVQQIEGLLAGEDDDNVKQYYEGWTTEDFEALLSQLRGEKEK